MFGAPFEFGRCLRKRTQSATNTRSSRLLSRTKRVGNLDVGLFLDNPQSQSLAVLEREPGQRMSHHRPLGAKINELLDALVISVRQCRDRQAELSHRAPRNDTPAKVGAQLVARDPEYPSESLTITRTAELIAIRQRLGESLSHKIDRNLSLQSPTSKKAQQVRGTRLIEARELIQVKRHRSLNV